MFGINKGDSIFFSDRGQKTEGVIVSVTSDDGGKHVKVNWAPVVPTTQQPATIEKKRK